MQTIQVRCCFHAFVLVSWGAVFTATAVVGDSAGAVESSLSSRSDVVFYGGFESYTICSQQWKTAWGIVFENRCSAIQILSGTSAFIGSTTIRVGYPKGGVGPTATGAQFPIAFSRISGMPVQLFDSLYLRYYVKFEEGFDFRIGGKLPGLMGGGESWKISGGTQSNGSNGWTMRLMWRGGGKAVVYAYLPGKYSAQWGYDFETGFTFTPGTWHCVEQYIAINDIGKENGRLYLWIDGTRVLTVEDIVYRTSDTDAGKIGGIYFSTFHGGNTSDWAPTVDSWAQFDGFVAARKRIGAYNQTPPSLTIITTSLPGAVVAMPYAVELAAENGVEPYAFSIRAGTLPAGLTLSGAKIQGTPSQAGVFPLTLQVTDAAGATAQRDMTLTVAEQASANLANQWTYLRDSGGLDPHNPVSGLWDGNITTEPAACPGSQTTADFWVEFDLKSVFLLTKVRLFGDAEGTWVCKTYTVEGKRAAEDGWTMIAGAQDCFTNDWIETETNVEARFIRLSVTGDVSARKFQVREFEVYGRDVSEPLRAAVVSAASVRHPARMSRIYTFNGRGVNTMKEPLRGGVYITAAGIHGGGPVRKTLIVNAQPAVSPAMH